MDDQNSEQRCELRDLDDLDPIVRILDVAGKRWYEYDTVEERNSLNARLIQAGRQYGLDYGFVEDIPRSTFGVEKSFSVARCMLTQTDWYRIFRDLKASPELTEKLDEIFRTSDLRKKSQLVDELRELNSTHKNLLTSAQAVALNAMLFCNDPSQFSSVVSLAHRKIIIEAFGLGDYQYSWSYGEVVVLSNELLKNFNRKFGVNFSPRKMSVFFYWAPVQPLWKEEKGEVRIMKSEVEKKPLDVSKISMPTFHELEEPEKKPLEEIVPSLVSAKFDLIVVDEAHKMSAYRYGDKTVHRRPNHARTLCDTWSPPFGGGYAFRPPEKQISTPMDEDSGGTAPCGSQTLRTSENQGAGRSPGNGPQDCRCKASQGKTTVEELD